MKNELTPKEIAQILDIATAFYKNSDKWDNEHQIEMAYIAPLLVTLGWSLKDGTLLYQNKDNVKTGKGGKSSKKPDFRLCNSAEASVFIIESKAPNINLDGSEKDPDTKKTITFPEKLCRYCKSAGLYWGVLTNFIEWRIYSSETKKIFALDCRRKYGEEPEGTRPFRVANDAIELTEDGYRLFCLLKEQFLVEKNGKISEDEDYYPEVSSLKDKLLKRLSSWRQKISTYLQETHKMDPYVADYKTQKILDQLIFIKVCFDRNVIPENHIESILQSKSNFYEELLKKFKILNKDFDSSLFYQPPSTNDSGADIENIGDLKINNESLEGILNELRSLNFSTLTVRLIGEVYENYLGKLIQQKNGIFYTDKLIVDHIIESTVCEKLNAINDPDKLQEFRVLDPACGSGSFLISVFDQILIRYEKLYKQRGQQYDLFDLKKNILLNNIYGIDIDGRAVQIAKLSLLLKALEGSKTSRMKKKKLLPDLTLNIRQGNSLISGDISLLSQEEPRIKQILVLKERYRNVQKNCDKSETERIDRKREAIKDDILHIEEQLNIKLNGNIQDYLTQSDRHSFINYQIAFCEVFESGGFDVIVGNPPYIKEYKNRAAFEGLHNSDYYQGKMDIFQFFTCIGLDLLKDGGCVSFIAPSNWITTDGASKMRKKIIKETQIKEFIDFGSYMVFDTAAQQTMIFVLKKICPLQNYKCKYGLLLRKNIGDQELAKYLKAPPKSISEYFTKYEAIMDIAHLAEEDYIKFLTKEVKSILSHVKNLENTTHLEKSEIAQGIVAPEEFVSKKNIENHNLNANPGDGVFVISNAEKKLLHLSREEEDLLRPYYTTNELGRYYSNPNNRYWIIYTGSWINDSINKYPNIKRHLDRYQPIITSSNKPYGLHRTRNKKIFTGEKLLGYRKCSVPSFAFSDFDCFVSQTFNLIKSSRFNLKYLATLLNSKLAAFWFWNNGKTQGSMFQIDRTPLLRFPIKKPNIDQEKQLIELFDTIYDLYNDHKSNHQQEIAKKEWEIDSLIYSLYGLDKSQVAEIEFSHFLREYRGLKNSSDAKFILRLKTDVEILNIFLGLNQYIDGKRISEQEANFLSDLIQLTSDVSLLQQAKQAV